MVGLRPLFLPGAASLCRSGSLRSRSGACPLRVCPRALPGLRIGALGVKQNRRYFAWRKRPGKISILYGAPYELALAAPPNGARTPPARAYFPCLRHGKSCRLEMPRGTLFGGGRPDNIYSHIILIGGLGGLPPELPDAGYGFVQT